MHLFGLIGYPLSHSFSKRYFTEKFEKEGMADHRYEIFPIEKIDMLPSLLKENPELTGLNVTVPHKKSVMSFLDDHSAIPRSLAACNCIRIKDGLMTGFNTDHEAFRKSLEKIIGSQHNHALIFGNGGAAAAVSYALRTLGISYDVVSRELHEGSTLRYEDLDKNLVEKSRLLINTTPLGMSPRINDFPPIPYQYISAEHLLYDLVYNPAKTSFLQKGEEKGAQIKNGEEMLILQAEESWRIWNM
jgi:shikimate dehydrogenase